MTSKYSEVSGEYEAHAQGTIEDALDLAAEDLGSGPLDPAGFLLELAAYSIVEAIFEHNIDPQLALDRAIVRAKAIMLEIVAEAKKHPSSTAAQDEHRT
jgi:hypothetical protein